MITHEEARKRVDRFNEFSISHDILQDYITEQEQRDKDVARYFYLKGMNPFLWDSNFNKEFYALEKKLSKVGEMK